VGQEKTAQVVEAQGHLDAVNRHLPLKENRSGVIDQHVQLANRRLR